MKTSFNSSINLNCTGLINAVTGSPADNWLQVSIGQANGSVNYLFANRVTREVMQIVATPEDLQMIKRVEVGGSPADRSVLEGDYDFLMTDKTLAPHISVVRQEVTSDSSPIQRL